MKLRNRLFAFTTIVVIVAVALASSLTVNAMYRSYREGIMSELLTSLRLIESTDSDVSSFNFGRRRFTEISPNGTVIFDSEANKDLMENHLERPEVQEALAHKVGFDIRESSTLLESMFYVAIVSKKDGNILRLSESQSSVFSFVVSSIPFILIVLILVIIAVLIVSRTLSKRIVDPINNIDLDHPISDDVIYDELSPLLRRIDDQKSEIKMQRELLERDKEELSLIVKNMKDGLILSRSSGDIIMINDAAKTLMGKNTSEFFSNILELSRDEIFFEIMEKGTVSTRVKIEGRTVEIHAERIEGVGSAVLIFDVSEKTALENKEREFIQNVSHELKTPLTSISGYSELIMRKDLDAEHTKEFSTQIYNEAKRLYHLIEDILAISRMDEEADVVFSEINVNDIARDVLDSIANPIVTLSEKEELRIKGNSTLIFEALYNLVDNAIKYNRDNNPIVLEIDEKSFAVKDSGIGLSPYDRERVFDRFYRVDKSRSRATGGTGLGLSIVKSVAERHNAKIEITSTLGVGTTIRLTF